MRAALADTTGLVVNVILVGEGYEPPDGLTIHVLDEDSPVGPGWFLIDGHSTEPPETTLPPAARTIEEQLAALKERLAAAEATTDQIILGALMGEFPPLI